jgi:hypothetical protein
LLDRWDYDLNKCNPAEVSFGTSKKYYLKCPAGIHKSEAKYIKSITLRNGSHSCNQCGSFYQWCLNNDRHDLLDRWDYDENKCDPWDISYASNKKYYFKCPIGAHESELKSITHITTREKSQDSCNKCNSFAWWGITNICENFLELYWAKENTVDPWEITKRSHKEILIICKEKDYHGDYLIKANNFNIGCRCPYCASKKIHPLDSLGKILEDRNLLDVWSIKNIKSAYEQAPMANGYDVWWSCHDGIHEDYLSSVSNASRSCFRCPECVRKRRSSFLQEKVETYISENYSYKINHEYNCTIVPKNPKAVGKNILLPFDNEIEELKLIIEVHGVQHYKITSPSEKFINTTSEYELHSRKLFDRYKKYIAHCYGYKYLVIPYWTEKDESYKTLIDNKISAIVEARQSEVKFYG